MNHQLIQELRNVALNAQMGTPVYDAAFALCVYRGLDPYGIDNNSIFSFTTIRSIIYEALLLRLIAL